MCCKSSCWYVSISQSRSYVRARLTGRQRNPTTGKTNHHIGSVGYSNIFAITFSYANSSSFRKFSEVFPQFIAVVLFPVCRLQSMFCASATYYARENSFVENIPTLNNPSQCNMSVVDGTDGRVFELVLPSPFAFYGNRIDTIYINKAGFVSFSYQSTSDSCPGSVNDPCFSIAFVVILADVFRLIF